MSNHRLLTIAAGVLIGAGLIIAVGRALDLYEIGSNTLAASLTIIGIILLAGSVVTKPRDSSQD